MLHHVLPMSTRLPLDPGFKVSHSYYGHLKKMFFSVIEGSPHAPQSLLVTLY